MRRRRAACRPADGVRRSLDLIDAARTRARPSGLGPVAPDLAVMSQTHHARAESIVGYVREGDPFRHTSAKYLGL
jgi:hypothetical protein